MSLITYRANLGAASFPFISRLHGRTIIIPSSDQNFNRQISSTVDSDKDVGVPQIYYCHNVMPNGGGYQSVGYEERIVAIDGLDHAMQQEITARDDSYLGGSKVFLMLGTGGFYWTDDEAFGYKGFFSTYWDGVGMSPLPADIADRQVTYAHVAGTTYIYISNFLCIKWDFAASRPTLVNLIGLLAVDVIGITESSGYLIAYTTNAVAWSSLIDPTDFVPSLQTGAGGGNVEGIKGNITCGAPTANGFMLYTEANVVSVLYTGNSQYPFQFSECIGAGGVTTLARVTFDSDSGFNYAYTSYGFQLIRGKSAESVFPDLTDFIAGQYFEDFDDALNTFSYQTAANPLKKKLAFVGNRYLVISYGINELTHAIIYDTVQKRFGKLKFTHTAVFQYDLLTENTSDIPRKNIGLLTKTGAMSLVRFDLPYTLRSGTILLGKYQYVRARNMQLQVAEVEGPTTGGTFSVYDLVSYDGKNMEAPIAGITLDSGEDFLSCGFGSPTGINHSILCKGTFNLTSLVLKFNIHGRM